MRDLSVTYIDETTGKLRRGFNGYPSKVSGRDWLVQKITKALFTETGSNKYDKNVGSAFAKMIGATTDIRSIDKMTIIITQSVEKVATDILSEQQSLSFLTDSERLLSIEVELINYDEATQYWEIFLRINMANSSVINIKV